MLQTALRRAARPAARSVAAAARAEGAAQQQQQHVRALQGLRLDLQQQQQRMQQQQKFAWPAPAGKRWLSSASLSDDELRTRTADFQDDFAEARMCLGDANDSLETVYFEEDLEDAQEAVKTCLANYEALVSSMSNEQAGAFKRENGLKVEQLKGELDALMQSLLEE